MAALGDVGREVKQEPLVITLTIAGALGMGDDDFSRHIKGSNDGSGGGPPGPTLPTYGQIFPRGQG